MFLVDASLNWALLIISFKWNTCWAISKTRSWLKRQSAFEREVSINFEQKINKLLTFAGNKLLSVWTTPKVGSNLARTNQQETKKQKQTLIFIVCLMIRKQDIDLSSGRLLLHVVRCECLLKWKTRHQPAHDDKTSVGWVSLVSLTFVDALVDIAMHSRFAHPTSSKALYTNQKTTLWAFFHFHFHFHSTR